MIIFFYSNGNRSRAHTQNKRTIKKPLFSVPAKIKRRIMEPPYLTPSHITTFLSLNTFFVSFRFFPPRSSLIPFFFVPPLTSSTNVPDECFLFPFPLLLFHLIFSLMSFFLLFLHFHFLFSLRLASSLLRAQLNVS